MAEDEKIDKTGAITPDKAPEKRIEEVPKVEKPLDMIEKGNLVALRLEEANKESRAIMAEQAELAIRAKLGGDSPAGQGNIEPPKEETPEEYAKRIMKGEEDEKKE